MTISNFLFLHTEYTSWVDVVTSELLDVGLQLFI